MTPPALVFFHRGKSWYLPYVLRQAYRFNKANRIILLTDARDRLLERFCEIHLLGDYSESADRLVKVFRNFSPNPPDYELFCLQRWLILRDFCAAHRIERAVQLDSDVMVYSDLSAAGRDFADRDVVLTGFQCPASTYINSQDALANFCDFVLWSYRENVSFLESSYRGWLAKGLTGGISDMHFLHEFVARGKWKFGDNSVVTNGSRFDECANASDGYAFTGERKDFQFIAGQPYGARLDTGERVRFHTIHFQGLSKKFIPGLSTRRDLYYYFLALSSRLRRLRG